MKAKVELEQLISDAARKAALEVVRQQQAASQSNHYKDTERLLRNYKAMKRLYEHPEDYTFAPPERSKSVTIAPPSGGISRDRQDMIDDAIETRMRSYGISCAQFRWIDSVVKQFEHKPEFVVIRMIYFGENANGQTRPDDSKRYTFEEISEELARVGLQRSEKTLRTWRSGIVQDMTVCLFVIDGALSIGNREPKQGRDDNGKA